MRPATIILLSATILVACASKPVPSVVVDSWTQRPEEHGKLQLAHVLSIVEVSIDAERRSSISEHAGLRAVLSPIVADAVEPLINTARSKGTSYRHTFRLLSGGERHLNLEFRYKIGECIAFRPGLSQDDVFPVRALPGECE